MPTCRELDNDSLSPTIITSHTYDVCPNVGPVDDLQCRVQGHTYWPLLWRQRDGSEVPSHQAYLVDLTAKCIRGQDEVISEGLWEGNQRVMSVSKLVYLVFLPTQQAPTC